LRDNPVRGHRTIWYVRSVTSQTARDRIALAFAGIALVLGLAATVFGSYDTGIKWRIDGDRLVVADVEPLTQAARDGIVPGLIAVDWNGYQLIHLPAYQYGEVDPATPEAPPPIIGTSPAVPTSAVPPEVDLVATARWPIDTVGLISEQGLTEGGPDRWPVRSFFYPGNFTFGQSQLAFLPGLVIILGGLWWLRSSRSRSSLQGLAIPLAVAASVPLLVAPVGAIGSFNAILNAGLLTVCLL
jgi:hypothetical protein